MCNDDDDVLSINNWAFNLNTRYNIIFRPNRYNIRVQHHALGILDADRLAYIFPTKDVNNPKPIEVTSLEIINKQICTNPEQLQAVKRIVAGANRYAPYIVVGPPGTGKTTTIVEAILQLYIRQPTCRILITAGSNSACDTVALKICEYFENHSKLIELSRERNGQKGLYGKFKKPKNILRVFAKSCSDRDDLLKKYANFIRREIVTPSVEVLQKYNIIVVTLCTMGRLRSGIIGDWPFTHIFIDEAGAITEPETLVAITSANTKNCRVIMSGDTKQLGPVIMSQVAAEFGLKHSLMERLVKRECYAVKEDGTYDSTLQTRLRRNYRSHPEILRLFNHLYYKDELIAEVKKDGLLRWNQLDMLKNKGFPIIFEAVRGQLGKSKSSQSSYNQAEVDKVICVTKKLLEHVDFKKIGIISPYKLQCAKIKGELRKCNLEDIEVGTVELFQGREKPIIIVSFVKSNCNLGFVTDPQRLNVILSRAQSLLIMIGNPETLQSNDDFKYLIEECKRMQTFR
ncbi:PREDICTED: putative helicase mov-10-B.1 [Rhagoletis zephyria]|uniref:putative helicase mov-10-B.1 n=1 Tax=Rhagoletis zephyria TaxID=28612 RepID=UPI000811426E|nr:PREDICTED: putative helicase mov-10-B.1 [Rhagoletis zephyria]